jgi:hypothetical protein
MAVLALKTTELGDDYRGKPVNDSGKMRFQFFTLPAVAVDGDATTTIDLCDLPPGEIRILPSMSRIATSAFGASRVLDVGHRAYVKFDQTYQTTITEAESANAFINDLDVSGAVADTKWSTTLKYDLYSKQGVRIFATVAGGTIPVAATINGYVAYIAE